MRVVICWSDVAGYTGACWRELAGRPGVDLFVLARHAGTDNPNALFNSDVVRGVPCRLLSKQEAGDANLVASIVADHRPDVVVLCGWFVPSYRRLPRHPSLQRAKFVLAMDTPLQHTWRQRLGKVVLRPFLARMHRVMVAGERSWSLATYLGVPERIIRRGMDSIDHAAMSVAYAERLAAGSWPRRFLYTGRYLPIKGIDVLLDAYADYRRARPSNPWPLTCCGRGELGARIDAADGVENLGFVQPSDLVGVLARHGVFVLPSRFDPWPLVLVEACAAGLPVIASDACGSAVELVRSFHNGLTVGTGDAASLTKAMCWMHDHYDQLPRLGRHGSEMSAPYSAQRWADRWTAVFEELVP